MTSIYNIDIPDGLDDIDKFGYVIDRIDKCKLEQNTPVTINLRNVRFISPYGLLGLLFIGKQIYERTGSRIHVIDTNYELIRYLERMDFFKKGSQWFHDPQIDMKFSRSSETKSLLEIQKISTSKDHGKGDVDDIVIKFRHRAASILSTFRKKMNVDFFVKVMSELCTNVYTHSGSDGYVAIQRYKYQKSGLEIVKLAVVDDGIGIRQSLSAKHKFDFLNDSEFIGMALEPGVSGAGDRGLGLHEVQKIVRDSSGYLWINSGVGAVLCTPDGKLNKYANLPSCRGARIAIILSLGEIKFELDTQDQHSLL